MRKHDEPDYIVLVIYFALALVGLIIASHILMEVVGSVDVSIRYVPDTALT